jgi:hypothetical protein
MLVLSKAIGKDESLSSTETPHLHQNTGQFHILVSWRAGNKSASSGGLTDGWRWQLATVGAKLSITGVGIRSHAGVADRLFKPLADCSRSTSMARQQQPEGRASDAVFAAAERLPGLGVTEILALGERQAGVAQERGHEDPEGRHGV